VTPTKVLLVHDDDSQWIKGLAGSLAKSDVTLLKAAGESEALELLERHLNVDVVVLDIEMGSLDCITFLRTVKKAHPLVQLVLLTGHGTVGAAIEGMKQGALDYLVKPCSAERLAAKVHDAKSVKARQEAKIAEALAMQIALHRGD
jgi:DNA-binding NtrC family response regulator